MTLVPPPLSLYVHMPWCVRKCPYCDFNSHGVRGTPAYAEYVDVLLADLDADLRDFGQAIGHRPIETVFFGGGTPSLFAPELVGRFLDGARQRLAFAPHAEITLETNPGTVEHGRFDGYLAAGVNRISFGVQSFDNDKLHRLGRIHSAHEAEDAVRQARDAGIDNINIDLIAGLPGQSAASWQESLDAALALDVPHLSIYMLEVDEDSRLGSEILLGGKRYGASDVPSDDQIGDFYESAVERLAANGIHRYEISNFARRGAESLHNLKYWTRAPYIGFGADAHSFDGTRRWQNVESAREYVGRSERGESVRSEATSPEPLEEKFYVGLRLSEGVHANEQDWQRYGATFEHFLATGILERANGNLRLTPRGVMVSNEVFQEFIGA